MSVPILILAVLFQSASPLEVFELRLQEYSSLRSRLETPRGGQSQPSDPAGVAARRRALADAIRSARAGTRQGGLFPPEVEDAFKQIIRREMAGPRGIPLRNAIRDGNPKVEGNVSSFQLASNAPYPDDQPLSTIPPGLLRRLPPLPPYLEYRFVGQDLILLDNGAGLIVDFIRRAAP